VTTIDDSSIYRDLMRFKPDGLSPNAWAMKAGVSRTVWGDMRRHGNPSRRTLDKLLTAAGSSLLEFEALRIGPEPRHDRTGSDLADLRRAWGPAPLAPLPLVASSLGGEWDGAGPAVQVTEIRRGELLDWLPRPVSLARDRDAYALTIVGDAMWPRFRPGSRIAVSPRSPAGVGDDVVARLGGKEVDSGERALIMHLVKRTASSFALRQFNPDVTIEVDVDAVDGVAKVIGELI
jgi:hypothetical protein